MNQPARYVKEYVEVTVSFAPDGTMYLPDFTVTFRGEESLYLSCLTALP